MPTSRVAAVFFVTLFLVVPLLVRAQGTVDMTADAKCKPVFPECRCGQKPNPNKSANAPKCVGGENMNQCFCENDNGQAGGICVALKNCKGTWYRDLDGERIEIKDPAKAWQEFQNQVKAATPKPPGPVPGGDYYSEGFALPPGSGAGTTEGGALQGLGPENFEDVTPITPQPQIPSGPSLLEMLGPYYFRPQETTPTFEPPPPTGPNVVPGVSGDTTGLVQPSTANLFNFNEEGFTEQPFSADTFGESTLKSSSADSCDGFFYCAYKTVADGFQELFGIGPAEAKPFSGTEPIRIGPDGRINAVDFYNTALEKFKDSSLNGYAPPGLRRFGVETGSPEEWARLATMVAMQESSLRVAPVNPDGTLQRFPTTPAGEQSYGPMQFTKGEYGLQTWADVNNPDRVIDAFVQVAEQGQLFNYFGSLQRPNETLQHRSWFQANVAPYTAAQPTYDANSGGTDTSGFITAFGGGTPPTVASLDPSAGMGSAFDEAGFTSAYSRSAAGKVADFVGLGGVYDTVAGGVVDAYGTVSTGATVLGQTVSEKVAESAQTVGSAIDATREYISERFADGLRVVDENVFGGIGTKRGLIPLPPPSPVAVYTPSGEPPFTTEITYADRPYDIYTEADLSPQTARPLTYGEQLRAGMPLMPISGPAIAARLPETPSGSMEFAGLEPTRSDLEFAGTPPTRLGEGGRVSDLVAVPNQPGNVPPPVAKYTPSGEPPFPEISNPDKPSSGYYDAFGGEYSTQAEATAADSFFERNATRINELEVKVDSLRQGIEKAQTDSLRDSWVGRALGMEPNTDPQTPIRSFWESEYIKTQKELIGLRRADLEQKIYSATTPEQISELTAQLNAQTGELESLQTLQQTINNTLSDGSLVGGMTSEELAARYKATLSGFETQGTDWQSILANARDGRLSGLGDVIAANDLARMGDALAQRQFDVAAIADGTSPLLQPSRVASLDGGGTPPTVASLNPPADMELFNEAFGQVSPAEAFSTNEFAGFPSIPPSLLERATGFVVEGYTGATDLAQNALGTVTDTLSNIGQKAQELLASGNNWLDSNVRGPLVDLGVLSPGVLGSDVAPVTVPTTAAETGEINLRGGGYVPPGEQPEAGFLTAYGLDPFEKSLEAQEQPANITEGAPVDPSVEREFAFQAAAERSPYRLPADLERQQIAQRQAEFLAEERAAAQAEQPETAPSRWQTFTEGVRNWLVGPPVENVIERWVAENRSELLQPSMEFAGLEPTRSDLEFAGSPSTPLGQSGIGSDAARVPDQPGNAPPAYEGRTKYEGHSIVDTLKGDGQGSSYGERKVLAKQLGIANYRGTAAQNLQMVALMREWSPEFGGLTAQQLQPAVTSGVDTGSGVGASPASGPTSSFGEAFRGGYQSANDPVTGAALGLWEGGKYLYNATADWAARTGTIPQSSVDEAGFMNAFLAPDNLQQSVEAIEDTIAGSQAPAPDFGPAFNEAFGTAPLPSACYGSSVADCVGASGGNWSTERARLAGIVGCAAGTASCNTEILRRIQAGDLVVASPATSGNEAPLGPAPTVSSANPGAGTSATTAPPPDPMTRNAQAFQNSLSRLNRKMDTFLNNPTDQTLQSLARQAQAVQRWASMFPKDSYIQSEAAKISGLPQASNYLPAVVATVLTRQYGAISAGISTVRTHLSRNYTKK
ncbi:hypothetical protein A3A39_01285 [Candidatus Kaiserbacteria bacterium RIFCSPLOWO2_01_FULL_54_13]|uniref:Transglycosylase SLT domain-containing protein n=1 Tax=Candidatus Kaiserbacteria bacterium RIFCSPLOWO2_01_FULL_54_13 TaxID=1798512 RepID=A0A1F6F2A3_9BACT|nr:MAG: hypothetical protein A3A39_01285 [Candidatus Kaiserbacteria bacterium RIFCSPLOWO2_01_FULL_54_13]